MMKENQDIWKKEFDELNAQERAYVSEWCETPEDYDMVRNFMLQLSQVDKQPVEPSKELKDQLMAEFPSTQRNRGIWLNLWLMIFPEEGGMNWKPILVTAMLIGVIVTIVFFQNPFSENKNNQLAENQMKEEVQDEKTETPEEEADDQMTDLKSAKQEESVDSRKNDESIELSKERSIDEIDEGGSKDERPAISDNFASPNEQLYLIDSEESPEFDDEVKEKNEINADELYKDKDLASEVISSDDQLDKKTGYKISESDKNELAEVEEESEKKDFSFFSSNRREKSKTSAPTFGGNVTSANEPAAGSSSVMQVNNAQKNKDLNSLLTTTY